MYNFLYHFPNFIWAVLGVVLAVFDLINLIMYFFGDDDKKVNKKKYLAILTISAIICFILYPIKNNLIEMPKVTPNTYANVVQLLDSYGISYETDIEVSDYTNTIVGGQSIAEGEIINKKNEIVILYLENKNDNSDDVTTTTQPPETDNSTSYEDTTTSDTENQGTEISKDISETTSPISVSKEFIETTSLPLNNNCENEPNNDFSEATPIIVNNNIEGILDSNNDEDYYIFNLTQKGKFSISFNHEKFDNNSVYWKVYIYNSNSESEAICKFDVCGNVAEAKSGNIRLPAGKYYCKIDSYSYKYCKYTFNLNFQDEYDGYEVENNNDFPQATPININQLYTGNLQDRDDKDYFIFEIFQKGNVSISFNHEQFDKSDNFWKILLTSGNSSDETILNFYSNGKTSSLTSDLVRLPAGIYNLQIVRDYYSNIDYSFSINYNQENEFFESEPNNDYKFATNINFDVEYTGNTQSKWDLDFYEINIVENNTNIELNFLHEIYDKDLNYWEIYISDENGNQIAILDENNKRFAYLNIKAREPQTKFYINDLTCGKYYIKICANNYINDDYSFFLTKA